MKIRIKKNYLAVALSIGVLFSSYTAVGQSKDSNSGGSQQHCFDENSRVLNVGLGLGASYYGFNRGAGYKYRRTPAFSISYEQAYPKKVGPGYIGVGGYLGYQGARLRYEDYYYMGNRYYYQHKWNYFVIGARAAYHWDVLNAKNAELYAGATVGLRIQTYGYETNSADPNRNANELSDGSVYPSFSLFAGGRWYFAKRVALYGEIGYGISYLTGGLSFKL